MVPVLLKALGDPNKFTEPALDKLLSTAFIHYIDGPSLALVTSVSHPPLILDTSNNQSGPERTECISPKKVSQNHRLVGKSN